MKRLFCFLAAILVLCITGLAKAPVAEGKTYCCLGNYIVDNAVDPITINGEPLKTFTVTYENSDVTVKIGIDRSDRACTRFIVISDELEIQYLCKNNCFGAKRISNAQQIGKYSTSELNLDLAEYYHQRVLSSLPMSEVDYLQLISVYFPRLIKGYEKILAMKM